MNKALTALMNNPDDLQRSLQPVLQHLPEISSMVLVLANAHILALITWMLFSDQESTAIAPLPTIKTTPQADNHQAFRQLTNAHLFGIMGKPKSTAVTNAPETRLNLVLKGILADNLMKNASVIISQGKGGKETVYGLGDKISGGVTIKEIYSEHIILERQGQLETLRLIKKSSTNNISLSATGTGLNKIQTTAKLKSIRKNIIKNPADFVKYAVPVIVKVKGKQIGYRLQVKQNQELLDQLGIKPTDVITSINGIKLNNPTNSMKALSKLSTANSVDITVRRNGGEVPLNIKLQ
jgi:general secretion pathway protein C